MQRTPHTPAFGSQLSRENARDKRRAFILLVDDDEDQLFTFKTLLERTDHNIVTASSVAKAIEILRDVHIDLVVSDLNMPNISGRDFISGLRRSQTQAYLPIISFSADAAYEESEVMSLGADAHCDKTKAKDLLNKVEDLLSTHNQTVSLLNEIETRFSK